jgi:hemerythrin superfamily protein
LTTAGETELPGPGEHLVEELLWVHGRIRRDLEICKELAADVAAGVGAAEINDRVEALKAGGPLWQLKFGCLHYCRFVHSHHTAEDVLIFPALRRSDPALGPVVDRLESDHRAVAVGLTEIESACQALVADDCGETRDRVAAALEAVTGTLLEHLAYEEESISPTLRSWERWPY